MNVPGKYNMVMLNMEKKDIYLSINKKNQYCSALHRLPIFLSPSPAACRIPSTAWQWERREEKGVGEVKGRALFLFSWRNNVPFPFNPKHNILLEGYHCFSVGFPSVARKRG